MVVLQVIGALIVGLVVAQLSLHLVSSVRRLGLERERRQLGLKLLNERVQAAALRRQEKERGLHTWEGFRKFVVQRKVEEGQAICSFYLAAHDQRPLPPFEPGQFLTFRLNIPGQPRPVIRCYSLSDHPQPDYYRVTIKQVSAPPDQADIPPGLVSNFFHGHIQEGEILDVQAPRGQFVLDLYRSTPIVLIAGGVGLTPMLCMANALAARGMPRETWLFYGVRNHRDQIMKEHLGRIAEQYENFHLRVCYSDPEEGNVQGKDYHHGKRVTVDLLKAELPSNNYEFYICGPPGMMAAVVGGLKEWGVPETKIFSEAFGPASAPKAAPAAPAAPASGAAAAFSIKFSRSGKAVPWDAHTENLLKFARANGVDIPSGCEIGNCGTCETALRSGEITYLREPGWKPQAGTCLVCIATPKGEAELDA